jgi:uncharacterized membrane protein
MPAASPASTMARPAEILHPADRRAALLGHSMLMAIARHCLYAAFWLGYGWCAYLIAANSLPYFGEAGRWQPFLVEKGAAGQATWYLIALRLHVIGGILCLAAILIQFSPLVLRRSPALHRWNGRIYGLSALLLVCLPGMPMALHAKGGIAGQAGFLLLGALTFWTTWEGIQAARQRDLDSHRRWMVCSFALVASAITFRLLHIALYLAAPVLDDATSYVICLYASIVGNLGIAGWIISRPRLPRPRHSRPRQEQNHEDHEDHRPIPRPGHLPSGRRPDPATPHPGR